jgi:3-hydroxymyristoyl/3-hydroxydecanoyl-(acyl carrier protein) dehydratase
MSDPLPSFPSDLLYRLALENARRGSGLHHQFLQARREGLQHVRALIELQTRSAVLPAGNPTNTHPALFDSQQLDAFGTGRISDCLGPAFAKYDGRRIPRIPNGDLKMMSRIVAISGRAGIYDRQASVTAEYDVPPDAWYLRENTTPEIPTALWMEIALQPCGFLSAYLDTYALVPHGEFYFRNLDGFLRLVERLDVRGKTITTQAHLLSNAVSGGTVIQKYAFTLTCEGHTLYQGESTFGYFSAASMASQMGLDGGQATAPAIRMDAGLAGCAMRVDMPRWQANPPGYRLAQNHLHFLDELLVCPQGGRHGQGYVYASRAVNPRDWYFPFHFYQDPVMPGSLGLEAILEAMRGFALQQNLGQAVTRSAGLRSARIVTAVPGAQPLTWRYRGQITQQHQRMDLEVHLSAIERQAGQVTLTGDASLWADGLRIYEVKNAAVAILEG